MTVFGGPFYETRLHTIGLGKQSVGPYGDWRVLDALASIPLTRRYVVGLRAKWILKDLLAAKVPDYPINQPKKATALPWQRFYTGGPLVGIFDRYPLPDVWDADPDLRRRVTEHPSPATWTAIMHAMWQQRIQTNPDLTPIGVVETYSVTFGGDGGTASDDGWTGGES